MLNDLRREVIVLFVDVGGIVDNYCLKNFLFTSATFRIWEEWVIC
jgi:hypothetical protein